MKPSKNAIAFIKQFEGCVLTAYQDVGGIWTIGYGCTGPGIVEGLTISQGTAEAMLLGHVQDIGASLVDLGLSWLTQNEFDALTSFIYNVGLMNFKKSSMLAFLREKKTSDAAAEFPRWDHVNGVAQLGLLKRRLAEQALFQSSSL